MSTYEAEVIRVELVGPYSVITLNRPEGFEFRAGQHVAAHFPGQSENFYSIASAPSEKLLTFCLLNVQAKVGDFLHLGKPRGKFHIHHPNRPLVFVAGGSGISPIRSLLHDFLSASTGVPVFLFYGCQNASAIPFLAEVQSWPLAGVHVFAEQGVRPGISPGRVLEGFKDKSGLLPRDAEFYLCGPPAMLTAVREFLTSIGIAKQRIWVDAA